MPTEADQGLLNALSATIVALENLIVLSERLCVRLRDGGADDDELRHAEEQLKAARERLPKLQALALALASKPKIH